MTKIAKHRRHERTLLKIALNYPGAHEEFPWGERVVKVKGKIFAFMGVAADRDSSRGLYLTVKLPWSRGDALDSPFAEPTGYNLGKSGWVTARFGAQDDVPLDLLVAWLDESYRAVAPKKLVKELDAPPTAVKPVAARRSAKQRVVRRRTKRV